MNGAVKTGSGKLANDFEHYRDTTGRVTLRIRCCACSHEDDYALKSGVVTCQQAFAEKKFAEMGWTVGSRRSKDKCSTCAASSRRSNLRVVSKEDAPIQQEPEPEHKSSDDEFLVEFIGNHLRKNAQGRHVYLTGYSDGRMLEELAADYPNLTINQIRTLRVAKFGIARVRTAEKKPDAEERIAALEEQIVEMARRLEEERTERLNILRRLDAQAEMIEMFVGPRGRSRRT